MVYLKTSNIGSFRYFSHHTLSHIINTYINVFINIIIMNMMNIQDHCSNMYMSPVKRKPAFCICKKTKTQISFAVTAKLISAFVFATRIVQPLYFLNTKFQASSHLVWSYSLVCVGPGQKPRRPVFSRRGSYEPGHKKTCIVIC